MSKLKHGMFLQVPYDFRRPTVARMQERWWNRDDKRIITPRVFGWGYAINFYQVFKATPSSVTSNILSSSTNWKDIATTIERTWSCRRSSSW